MIRQLWGCLLSFFILSVPWIAKAWGPVGHGAVGLIAEKTLSPQVRAIVIDLLAGQDFAQAGVWADTIKNTPPWIHGKPYHFADIPQGTNYFQNLATMNSQQRSLGDVVRGLSKAEDILRNPKTSKLEKTYALKFMFHFIGDLHQPMHVGYPTDKGGNTIPVSWFGTPANLHAVWDSLILTTFIQRSLKILTPSAQDYLILLRRPSPQEINAWQNSYIMTWLNESLALRVPAYAGDANESETYYQQSIAAANERVLKAGIRLGGWLTKIITGQRSAEALKLRQDLQTVLGPDNADQIILQELVNPSFQEYLKNHYKDPCAGHQH